MALTVRPDDEVYQFDTVWLGPDEYTLPIQARYVAWGTWLACFLVAVVILVPLGGNGPGGVLGSLIWSFAVSVVLARAVMLVVDHERPLRSLPALFSAEARAALAARTRGERSLLMKADKVTVRDTPAKVLEMRRHAHERAARKWAKRHPEPVFEPVDEIVEGEVVEWQPEWAAADEWAEPAPTWSVPADDVEPVPVPPVVRAAVVEPARGPFRDPGPVVRGRHAAPEDESDRPHDRQAAVEARILLPARKDR
jgi:hypothetical protein